MSIIKTESFRLAVNIKGDLNSNKIAILLPGRLDTKDYQCFDRHLEYLAGKGFFAVCFDPPGTWDSPGSIKLLTTTNYIKSTNELIDYYGNRPTLLIGHSRGGATAILVGNENPATIGIVAIMPSLGAPSYPSPEEIRGDVYWDSRDLPPGTKKTVEQKKFEVPLGYFSDGEKHDDAKVLRVCTKPKLIFYGTKDEFNPSDEVKEVFDKAPGPKMLHGLTCTHDYRYYPEIVEEVNKVIGDFLIKNKI